MFIPGSAAPSKTHAEWYDAKAPAGPNHIAANANALAKAPANSSKYEAKLFNYPSGSLRVLTWKKGEAVYHQVTFETEIYVLQGTATLTPLRGFKSKPVKLNQGDALFLPSGVIDNPKPTEDFVILQAFVNTTDKTGKRAIIDAKNAKETQTAQWQADGKDMTASKPDDVRKAPANAARFTTKRYEFEGSSIRVATLKKGGRTNLNKQARADVLIYLAKGRLRRQEGDQSFEMVAGDTTREKMDNTGYWEILEDSVFIATDAPATVASPSTGWAIALADVSKQG